MSEPLLHREFRAAIAGDGRTLDLRVVPFNEPADVADPPDWTPYREMFMPGSFKRQLSAADRVKVWLNFEHEQGLRGIVGHGAELEERDDGLYGRFRVHENSDGEKALELVREGILTGLSCEFAALRSFRRNGIVERVRAHLDRVSLCRIGAYAGAQVLAVRTPPPAPALPAFDPALAERAGRLGITIPGELRP